VHTCDRRSTKSQIRQLYPESIWVFEKGFTEQDERWNAE
jgi:hypothetical protein